MGKVLEGVREQGVREARRKVSSTKIICGIVEAEIENSKMGVLLR